jgi:hypothetical protein
MSGRVDSGLKENQVQAVLDQWYDPESILYRVLADDRESLHPSTTNSHARGSVGFGFISPNERGTLTRLAGHTSQD